MNSYEKVENLLQVKMFEKYSSDSIKNISFTEKHIKTLQDILNFGISYYNERYESLWVKLYSDNELFDQKTTCSEFYRDVYELFLNSYVHIENEMESVSFRFVTSISPYIDINSSSDLDEIVIRFGSDLSQLIINHLEINNN